MSHNLADGGPAPMVESGTDARRADAASRTGAGLRHERLAATLARDRGADGVFWCSVETTRIFCRPSCPSRHAKPENIRFHDTLAQAQATGFRPCARCRPDQPSLHDVNLALIQAACRTLASGEGAPSSSALAAASGLSRSYFHRLFKAVTGLSPQDFAREITRSRGTDADLHATRPPAGSG